MKTINYMKKEKPFDRQYPAIVVDNNDLMGVGRLAVKIPPLLGEETIWVYPEHTNGSVLTWWAPDIGDIVNVKFLNQDIKSGVWFTGMSGGQLILDFLDEAPISSVWGVRDKEGNIFKIDRVTKTIYVHSEYDIVVDAVNDIKATAGNDILATAGNVINATAATSATVKAPTITLDGDVAITGALNVAGATTLSGTCVFESIAWAPHVHICAAAGSPSGAPQ